MTDSPRPPVSLSRPVSPWIRVVPVVVLGMMAFLLYFQTLRFGLLRWDDDMLIGNNPVVQQPSVESLRKVWLEGYAGIYMPLTYSWWALLERGADWWGPGVHHAGNVLLYIAATAGVYGLFSRLLGYGLASTLATLVWLIHPCQVESVAWASEAKGLLALALGIWGVNLQLDAATSSDAQPNASRTAALAQLLYLLALLAKPSAVAWPMFAAVLHLFWFRRSGWQTARLVGGWIVLGLAFVAITGWAQAAVSRVDSSIIHRPWIAFDAIGFYLHQWALPTALGPDYGRTPGAVLALPWDQSIHGFLGLGIAVIFVLAVTWKGKSLATGLGIFLAALVPVLGLIPFGFQAISTVADRYLLVPTVGLALLFGSVVHRAGWKVAPLVLALSGIWGYASFQQMACWRSDDALIAQALTVRPESGTFLSNRSALRLQRGDFAGAEKDAHQALADRPTLTSIYFNLAAAQSKQGKVDDALSTLEAIFKIEPADRRAAETIIATLVQQKRFADAIPYARLLADKPPHAPSDVDRLARLLIVSGQEKEGIALLSKALGTDLDPPKDVLAMAQIFEQMGLPAQAVQWYGTLLQRSGGFRAAKRRLAWILATSFDEAVRDPARSLRLARELTGGAASPTPADLDVLAAAYAATGDFKQAILSAERALERLQQLPDQQSLAEQVSHRLEGYRRKEAFITSPPLDDFQQNHAQE